MTVKIFCLYNTACLVQNWGQSCTQTCGKCSNTEIPCDFTTGKCPPPGCSPWFTDERCLTELGNYNK